MTAERETAVTREALRLVTKRCPRLAAQCYWAGTASVAVEELQHRRSFDLDFHTLRALQDVRPVLAEIRQAFPGRFCLVRAPDEFGSGFSGVLELPDGNRITVEVLSNREDVPDSDLVASSVAAPLRRVSLERYLADKVQCVAERVEARDLADIEAVLRRRPDLELLARRLVAGQDAVLLCERLLAWTDASVRRDLAPYADVSPETALAARDRLLAWLKPRGRGGGRP